MKITIDPNSGFCFGVVNAINAAETALKDVDTLFCLGDIVHNNAEVERLKSKGLQIIDHQEFKKLHDVSVLIRAHGEPPETYKIAMENNIKLIDASCPVVLRLQNSVRKGWDSMEQQEGQIVIYGKDGHAEVAGLAGQTGNKALIVNSKEDIKKIDFNKPISLYSQTTQSIEGFNQIIQEIQESVGEEFATKFTFNDSICRQVSHRAPQLREFVKNYNAIVFVSGKKSSNGKYLYGVCKENNPNTYFISSKEELDAAWFSQAQSVGICGATSTPMWLMEEVKEEIDRILENESPLLNHV